MVSHVRQFSERICRYFWRHARAGIHFAMTAVVLMLALEFGESKSLGGGEDCKEDFVAVMRVSRQFQSRARLQDEPVYTAHHHARVLREVCSMADRDLCPVEGHRLENGLNAPLRT